MQRWFRFDRKASKSDKKVDKSDKKDRKNSRFENKKNSRNKDTFGEYKGKNAQKSKIAAFNLKGKALPETKDLTLREELEMRFAELNQQ